MVTHKRSKHTECKETKNKVTGCIFVKASEICTAVKKAAHICRREHFEVKKNVRPPRVVITEPDTAWTVSAYIWRTGEHKDFFFTELLRKIFAGGLCHISTVNVVNLIMANLFAVNCMVNAWIILGTVWKTCECILEFKEFWKVKVLSFKRSRLIKCFVKSFYRIENCRLVHIVPEAVNSHICENFIFWAEPLSYIRTEKIGKANDTGPYTAFKIRAILVFAEVSVLSALFIDIVAVLFFYACVNNRNEVDSFFPFLWNIVLEIRKFFIINSKVLVTLHIVDVEIYAVKRNFCLVVTVNNSVNSFGIVIAPTALLIAECPKRRNIACTDWFSELFYDFNRLCAVNVINIKIRAVNCDNGFVCGCIADVPTDFWREVDKNTKSFWAAEHKKIVSGIEGWLCFGVERVITAKAVIHPTTLVDSSRSFAETVDDVAVCHIKFKDKIFVLKLAAERKFRNRQSVKFFNNSLRINRVARCKLFNH